MTTITLLLTLLILPIAQAGEIEVIEDCVVTEWLDKREVFRSPIIDGDTIYCFDAGENLHKVRLRGVDAPEIKFGAPQCYAHKAREYVASRIYGKRVKVVVEDRDRFDRELGYVYYDNRLLNLDLVASGYARAETRYKAEYINPWTFWFVEQIPKSQGWGLWGECEGKDAKK